MQFGGTVVKGRQKQLEKLRAAEDAYWVKMGRLNSQEGIIGLEKDTRVAGADPEKQAATLGKLASRVEKSGLAFLPPGYVPAGGLMKSSDIGLHEIYPVIVRQWCHFTVCPPRFSTWICPSIPTFPWRLPTNLS